MIPLESLSDSQESSATSSQNSIKHFSLETKTSASVPATIETSHFKGDKRCDSNANRNMTRTINEEHHEHNQCDNDFQGRQHVIFQGSCKFKQNEQK